jgi:hypothetical protein
VGVKPFGGASVSTATIARVDTATTVAPCGWGLVHALFAFPFSDITVPTLGGGFDETPTIADRPGGGTNDFERFAYHSRAAANLGLRSRRSISRIRISKPMSRGVIREIADRRAGISVGLGAFWVAAVFVELRPTAFSVALVSRLELNATSAYSDPAPPLMHSDDRSTPDTMCTSPTFIESGVTLEHRSCAAVAETEIVFFPTIVPIVALIEATPAEMPVTTPDDETVATSVSDEPQVNVCPETAALFASNAPAVSVIVDPIVTDVDAPPTAIEATVPVNEPTGFSPPEHAQYSARTNIVAIERPCLPMLRRSRGPAA